ncbi:hypothetical protein HLBENOHH_02083 [Aeromonas dhakensis]|uniref:hypothetical protein n=1 Tax=Aeromonas dhakensis TaxID=196024 RepID=UPI00366F1D73
MTKDEQKKQQLLNELNNSILLRQDACAYRRLELAKAQSALQFEERALEQLQQLYNRKMQQ